MDDCNLGLSVVLGRMSYVQIPLWTIVTAIRGMLIVTTPSSDSSMDDCNGAAHA